MQLIRSLPVGCGAWFVFLSMTWLWLPPLPVSLAVQSTLCLHCFYWLYLKLCPVTFTRKQKMHCNSKLGAFAKTSNLPPRWYVIFLTAAHHPYSSSLSSSIRLPVNLVTVATWFWKKRLSKTRVQMRIFSMPIPDRETRERRISVHGDAYNQGNTARSFIFCLCSRMFMLASLIAISSSEL